MQPNLRNCLPIMGAIATIVILTPATAKASDLVTTLAESPRYTTLVAAVKAANLVDKLKGDGPFTVFAPNDAAFAKLPAGVVEGLLRPENRDRLKAILAYHVAPYEVLGSNLSRAKSSVTINTLNEDSLVARRDGHGLRVGGANVTRADVLVDNGVIHTIDAVLIPPSEKEFISKLVGSKKSGDIVEVAAKAGSFKTLLAAAKAAGLVDVLKSDGPLTVFAPTDAAFAKLPKDQLAALLRPENRDKLAAILKFHVLAGKVESKDVLALGNGGTVKTVNGASVSVRTKNGIRIGGAKVVQADIEARNGVIHVIDSVLIPPIED